jgi:hypothetical protein
MVPGVLTRFAERDRREATVERKIGERLVVRTQMA